MAEAAEVPIKKELLTRADYERYIDQNASRYGVSPAKIKAIVSCETGGTWNPTIVGDHGQSHGLVQIHAPSHTNISISQMNDPKFALDYIMENLGKDRWSCESLI